MVFVETWLSLLLRVSIHFVILVHQQARVRHDLLQSTVRVHDCDYAFTDNMTVIKSIVSQGIAVLG